MGIEGGDNGNNNDKKKPSPFERFKEYSDDPKPVIAMAIDTLAELETVAIETPELGISQEAVLAETGRLIDLATKHGSIDILEDEIERIQRDDLTFAVTPKDRERLTHYIAVLRAYLEFTQDDD